MVGSFKRKNYNTCRGNPIRITAGFSMETLKSRVVWSKGHQVLKKTTDVIPDYCAQKNYLPELKEKKINFPGHNKQKIYVYKVSPTENTGGKT